MVREASWGLGAFVWFVAAGGCASATDARIDVVRRFNDARDRGDLTTALSMLTPDARVWYENPTGSGSPWKPGEGPWAGWDACFRSTKRVVGDYQRDGDSVFAVFEETNDYYRLTDREWSRTLLTWYVTDDLKIRGFFVAGIGEFVSKAHTFEEWARQRHPAEYEYLCPDGRIDPRGDRPARMKALLVTWRVESGMPAVGLDEHATPAQP